MRGAVVRRVVMVPVTALVVSLAMFVLLYVGPNPLAQLHDQGSIRAADVERLTEQYGWDRPWYEQYGTWLSGVSHGDWGRSIRTQQAARSMIAERLPLTLALTSLALALSMVVAVPMAILSALRRRSTVDYALTLVSLALMALPGFFVALLLQLITLKLKDASGHLLFPTGGGIQDGGAAEWVRRLALPSAALAAVQVASWSRYLRGELLGALASDFVTSAAGKGLDRRALVVRHALRATLVPITTMLAIDIGYLIGGSIVVESIFGLPGTGALLLQSVEARDIVVVLDLVVLGALVMVAVNALADVVAGWLDPRIRQRGR